MLHGTGGYTDCDLSVAPSPQTSESPPIARRTSVRGPNLVSLGADFDAKFEAIPWAHKVALRENKDVDIAQRYQIDAKEFGCGGNGKVFVGRDRTYGDRKVAIKKIVCNDASKMPIIQREVTIMKDLDHPNICKLFESYEMGRFLYYVMELCEGGELFSRIQEAGNVRERDAADIINQIASSLHYAHSKNIAHRDLKPENVCFASEDTSDNHVKVIDWGLGFYFGGLTKMKSAVGSVAYAAPEVLEADQENDYTSACDLWSLGAMAYVMLCGRPPFWGSIVKQLTRMKAEKYPMKDDPWDSISDAAKDFVRCLLRSDPALRLPTGRCLEHPWLQASRQMNIVGKDTVSAVLWNMEKSSMNSKFLSVCLASAARQLDCKSLKDIRDVFERLDTNHDGALDMEELKTGLTQTYGMDSEQAQNVARMFDQLDLDSDGSIDYTEFCSAALGEKMLEQENILWMAFKSFDVHADDGKIHIEEIAKVLSQSIVREAWSPAVCDTAAKELVQTFDQNKLGYLDFDAWVKMMRTVAWPEPEPSVVGTTPFQSCSSQACAPPRIAWVSLDPRSGDIPAYPLEICQIIEAHFRLGKEGVDLGSKFHQAKVFYRHSVTGLPFQKTASGMRDVRRLEIFPGIEEGDFLVSGEPGEYRFAKERGTKRYTMGASANAADDRSVSSYIQLLEDSVVSM